MAMSKQLMSTSVSVQSRNEIRISHRYQRVDLYSVSRREQRCMCLIRRANLRRQSIYNAIRRYAVRANERPRCFRVPANYTFFDRSKSLGFIAAKAVFNATEFADTEKAFLLRETRGLFLLKKPYRQFRFVPFSSSSFAIARDDIAERRERAIPLSIRCRRCALQLSSSDR